MSSTIPTLELTLYVDAVIEAVDLANTGNAADGVLRLAGGRDQAQAAAASGAEWGTALAHRYQYSLESYATEHQLPAHGHSGSPGDCGEDKAVPERGAKERVSVYCT